MERTVDRDANLALWNRFAEVQSQYERMRDGLADLHQQLSRLQITVDSDDELVTAVVNARGQLVRLKLKPDAFGRCAPDELAAIITDTVRLAGAEASEEVTELISVFLPESAGATAFVSSGDFGELLHRQDEATGYDPSVHRGR